MTYAELDSSISQAQGHVYHLCGSHRPPDPVPPPGPAVGGGKIRAWSSPAPLIGLEGIGSSSQSWAPSENLNAREPGRVLAASVAEDYQLAPGPSSGPSHHQLRGTEPVSL